MLLAGSATLAQAADAPEPKPTGIQIELNPAALPALIAARLGARVIAGADTGMGPSGRPRYRLAFTLSKPLSVKARGIFLPPVGDFLRIYGALFSLKVDEPLTVGIDLAPLAIEVDTEIARLRAYTTDSDGRRLAPGQVRIAIELIVPRFRVASTKARARWISGILTKPVSVSRVAACGGGLPTRYRNQFGADVSAVEIAPSDPAPEPLVIHASLIASSGSASSGSATMDHLSAQLEPGSLHYNLIEVVDDAYVMTSEVPVIDPVALCVEGYPGPADTRYLAQWTRQRYPQLRHEIVRAAAPELLKLVTEAARDLFGKNTLASKISLPSVLLPRKLAGLELSEAIRSITPAAKIEDLTVARGRLRAELDVQDPFTPGEALALHPVAVSRWVDSRHDFSPHSNATVLEARLGAEVLGGLVERVSGVLSHGSVQLPPGIKIVPGSIRLEPKSARRFEATAEAQVDIGKVGGFGARLAGFFERTLGRTGGILRLPIRVQGTLHLLEIAGSSTPEHVLELRLRLFDNLAQSSNVRAFLPLIRGALRAKLTTILDEAFARLVANPLRISLDPLESRIGLRLQDLGFEKSGALRAQMGFASVKAAEDVRP